MAKQAAKGEFASFESEFERLGVIVSQLESGNIPLDEMLGLYEEGTTLAATLSKMLKSAELKVEKLSKVHEELATYESEPFSESN
jgi:exodeoxyribonuclease VII small subunit